MHIKHNHAHDCPVCLPPSRRQFLARTGAPNAAVAGWTRSKAVEELDKSGVRIAVLSLASTPGTWFDLDPPAASRMARICQDFAAELVRDHPGRFGIFAPLSMLNADLTLKEIEYAFDT